jgi:hypothetical protein
VGEEAGRGDRLTVIHANRYLAKYVLMSKSSLERVADVLSPKCKRTADATVAFLLDSRLQRWLSSLSANGFPQITSLWFGFRGGRFLCCTQR